jgi:hypothetical protein
MSETYAQVGYFYPDPRPAWLVRLLDRARTETVHIGYFSDSRGAPYGSGRAYICALQHQFVQRYGNLPRTGAMVSESAYITGLCGGLTINGRESGVLGTSGVASANYAPGHGPTLQATVNAAHGYLWHLAHDGAMSLLPKSVRGDYFAKGSSVTFKALAFTASGSAEIAWRTVPTDNPYSTFGTTLASGTSSLGLDSATLAVKTLTIADVGYNNLGYAQVVCRNSDNAKTLELGSGWFESNADPAGVAVTTFSVSGYKAADVLANHATCGEHLLAFDCDAYWLDFGTNEAGVGKTAAQFKADTLALIAQLRTWHGDSTLPVIVSSVPYRTGLTAGQTTEWEQYAGALKEICQSDPYVYLVNAARILADLGWTSANEGQSTTGAAAWATSTAYVVGNIVTLQAEHDPLYFVCIQAHTSAASAAALVTSNRPPNPVYWRQINKFTRDGIHDTLYGAEVRAQAQASALFGLDDASRKVLLVNDAGTMKVALLR